MSPSRENHEEVVAGGVSHCGGDRSISANGASGDSDGVSEGLLYEGAWEGLEVGADVIGETDGASVVMPNTDLNPTEQCGAQ